MKIRRALLKDLVSIETYTGDGAYGPVFNTAVTFKVNVDQTRRLVRNAAGVEVVSEATLMSHPEPRDEVTGLLLDGIALITPGSRITVSGRSTTVLGVAPNTIRGGVVFLKVTVA